jgi:hypothetical protein
LAVVFLDSQTLTGAQLRGLGNLRALVVLRVAPGADAELEAPEFTAADLTATARRLPVLAQLDVSVACASQTIAADAYRALATNLSSLRLRLRVNILAVLNFQNASEPLFPHLRSLEMRSFAPPPKVLR